MLDLIGEITKLLEQFVEVHYQWNFSKTVTYPYLVYTYTTEPLENDQSMGVYIDFDLFDNRGRDNERIETVHHDMLQYFKNKDNQVHLHDDFLIRFDSLTISPFPTGSDTLQRRTGQLYARIDWRK